MAEVIGKDMTAGKEVTHQECGARLRYFPGEVRVLWSGRDYGGGPDGAKGFTCPNCGRDVITERW